MNARAFAGSRGRSRAGTMSEEMESRGGRPRPDAMDIHVGARLRERRLQLGMTQEQLADSIGLTFQQIQKYERGVNRMGASRLWEVARALDVPLDFFYGHGEAATRSFRVVAGFADRQDAFGDATEMPADARDLIDAFGRITDKLVRQRVLDLVKSLAPARGGN